MASYIKDNFLLDGKNAETLYFDYASKMPILDYHCHLSEYDILENKQFNDIYELWLSADHYKWRLMRNYGVNEEYITGKKSPKEKFLMYCKVLGTAFGNPLYHWSQLELKHFFDCDIEINEKNAEAIWDYCNNYIKEHKLTPQKVIEKSNVKYIFTTNEVFDDLRVFYEIEKKGYNFTVKPAFRADKVMNIDAEKYNFFIDKLGKINTLADLKKALEDRLNEFIKAGAVASDIAIEQIYKIPSEEVASKIFLKRRNNEALSEQEVKDFKMYLTYYLLSLYGKYNIRSELHIGAIRNNNSKMFSILGADTGFDSIGEAVCIEELARLLDRLNNEGVLPPMIIFNLNPKMNMEILTLIGTFQSDELKGRIQFGAAWWFLDNKVGITNHLKDLSSSAHLATFIGMLTDSRSFLSYPRHHYFRRILCNYLGELMEKGEITQDIALVGKVVEDICYNNAYNYLIKK